MRLQAALGLLLALLDCARGHAFSLGPPAAADLYVFPSMSLDGQRADGGDVATTAALRTDESPTTTTDSSIEVHYRGEPLKAEVRRSGDGHVSLAKRLATKAPKMVGGTTISSSTWNPDLIDATVNPNKGRKKRTKAGGQKTSRIPRRGKSAFDGAKEPARPVAAITPHSGLMSQDVREWEDAKTGYLEAVTPDTDQAEEPLVVSVPSVEDWLNVDEATKVAEDNQRERDLQTLAALRERIVEGEEERERKREAAKREEQTTPLIVTASTDFQSNFPHFPDRKKTKSRRVPDKRWRGRVGRKQSLDDNKLPLESLYEEVKGKGSPRDVRSFGKHGGDWEDDSEAATTSTTEAASSSYQSVAVVHPQGFDEGESRRKPFLPPKITLHTTAAPAGIGGTPVVLNLPQKMRPTDVPDGYELIPLDSLTADHEVVPWHEAKHVLNVSLSEQKGKKIKTGETTAKPPIKRRPEVPGAKPQSGYASQPKRAAPAHAWHTTSTTLRPRVPGWTRDPPSFSPQSGYKAATGKTYLPAPTTTPGPASPDGYGTPQSGYAEPSPSPVVSSLAPPMVAAPWSPKKPQSGYPSVYTTKTPKTTIRTTATKTTTTAATTSARKRSPAVGYGTPQSGYQPTRKPLRPAHSDQEQKLGYKPPPTPPDLPPIYYDETSTHGDKLKEMAAINPLREEAQSETPPVVKSLALRPLGSSVMHFGTDFGTSYAQPPPPYKVKSIPPGRHYASTTPPTSSPRPSFKYEPPKAAYRPHKEMASVYEKSHASYKPLDFYQPPKIGSGYKEVKELPATTIMPQHAHTHSTPKPIYHSTPRPTYEPAPTFHHSTPESYHATAKPYHSSSPKLGYHSTYKPKHEPQREIYQHHHSTAKPAHPSPKPTLEPATYSMPTKYSAAEPERQPPPSSSSSFGHSPDDENVILHSGSLFGKAPNKIDSHVVNPYTRVPTPTPGHQIKHLGSPQPDPKKRPRPPPKETSHFGYASSTTLPPDYSSTTSPKPYEHWTSIPKQIFFKPTPESYVKIVYSNDVGDSGEAGGPSTVKSLVAAALAPKAKDVHIHDIHLTTETPRHNDGAPTKSIAYKSAPHQHYPAATPPPYHRHGPQVPQHSHYKTSPSPYHGYSTSAGPSYGTTKAPYSFHSTTAPPYHGHGYSTASPPGGHYHSTAAPVGQFHMISPVPPEQSKVKSLYHSLGPSAQDHKQIYHHYPTTVKPAYASTTYSPRWSSTYAPHGNKTPRPLYVSTLRPLHSSPAPWSARPSSYLRTMSASYPATTSPSPVRSLPYSPAPPPKRSYDPSSLPIGVFPADIPLRVNHFPVSKAPEDGIFKKEFYASPRPVYVPANDKPVANR